MRTGDPKVDSVLAQIEAGRILVSDRVRTEIDELAGGLDGVPDSHPDRPETLDRLRTIVGEVARRHNEMVDPFIEDERNVKVPFEDGQGNLVVRETDAKGHARETISMTRDEVAAKRVRQREVQEELAQIKELHGQADEFAKAAVGQRDAQAQALKERADQLRQEARDRKDALRQAGVNLKPTVEEVMRARRQATGEVANVLALSREGRFGEALDAAHALDPERLYELAGAADDRDRTLLDVLRRESSDHMTARAAAGAQIVREGM